LAKRLSSRHLGVGGDGIITVKRLSEKELEMRIFNADGSEGLTCGNGLRCAHLFAKNHLGETDGEVTVFTKSGATVSRLIPEGQTVCDGRIISSLIECDFPPPLFKKNGEILAKELQKVGLYIDKQEVFEVNTGNNHLVFITDKYQIEDLSKGVKRLDFFPDGINIERIYSIDKRSEHGYALGVDFFERGSGKTTSCGSGTVALSSAFSLFLGKPLCPLLRIEARGEIGFQSVSFWHGTVRLKGQITEVFKGEYYEI
jgi:diaminopimelate epimerase